jgi:hypothetical protein
LRVLLLLLRGSACCCAMNSDADTDSKLESLWGGGGFSVAALQNLLSANEPAAARTAVTALSKSKLPPVKGGGAATESGVLPASFVLALTTLPPALVGLMATFLDPSGSAVGAEGGDSVVSEGDASGSSAESSSLGPSASAVGPGAEGGRCRVGGGGGGGGGCSTVGVDPQHAQKRARDALLKQAGKDPFISDNNRSFYRGVWRHSEREWMVRVAGLETSLDSDTPPFRSQEAAELAYLEHAKKNGVTDKELLYREGVKEFLAEQAARKRAKT